MADPIRSHPDNAALDTWWQGKLTHSEEILSQNGIDALWWSYRLFDAGVVQDEAELNQTLRIVLSTPVGSDVHRPDFSSGIWNFVDYPIPRATPFVVRESTLAVDRWEPRITLDSVAIAPYAPGIAGLTVRTSWTVSDSDSSGQTEVALV